MPTNIKTEANISQLIWDTYYRWREDPVIHDITLEDTWRRVAVALAAAEPMQQEHWEKRFFRVLQDFQFLPGGRILAGAGTNYSGTLFNCFAMGLIEDSVEGVAKALEETVITLRSGGGAGIDFSTLRPTDGSNKHLGIVATMHLWENTCVQSLSAYGRNCAMMGTLRCDHPDIEFFIKAKQSGTVLRHFNLSVLITDTFMQAVAADTNWPLVFPMRSDEKFRGETLLRNWPGYPGFQRCQVYCYVPARALWEKIIHANYAYAEPGIIFIDRVQTANNLEYCERIYTTNPCGEVPLPPYGACNLGSINLTRFIREPFSVNACVDWEGIEKTADVATRMLDNVYEISSFPLLQQKKTAHQSRRIGLGITGLADALIMLGKVYGEPDAIHLAGDILQHICHAAYRSSIRLSVEKGTFPTFSAKAYLSHGFAKTLPEEIVHTITEFGLRNSHLIAVAPTGTISLLAGNVSNGLEPVFAAESIRKIHVKQGQSVQVHINPANLKPIMLS